MKSKGHFQLLPLFLLPPLMFTIVLSMTLLSSSVAHENDCASHFISTLMSWLDAHEIGYLAWTWNPYNCSSTPSLITSYTGTPTNFGQGYKSHLLTLGGSTGSPLSGATLLPL